MFAWLPKLRLYGLLLLLAAAGCGSDAPTAPPSPAASPLQQVTFSYVKESDLNTYLRAIASTLPDFYLIIDEQTVLFNDWSTHRTNTYWTRVYANNLVLRIRAYSLNAAKIRPTNPELKKLHDQLLQAMQFLEAGIQDFIVAMDPRDDSVIDEANKKIGQFNIAIDSYSNELSSLAGQPISLFPSQ